MKATVTCVLLCLLSALVVVHSQTVPYITFKSIQLSNHSYVNLRQVGQHVGEGVKCHTDLYTCCSGAQGQHRGNWYYPNGERLPFYSMDASTKTFQSRQALEVELRQLLSDETSGIYHCDIAVNNGHRETVYAGLYHSGGSVMVSEDMKLTVDIDLSGVSPQFTLTCISTGGPATTVTWTRDSMELSGGMTLLNNTVTAQYIHTLTVTGTMPGRYRCTVSNNKPSSAAKTFIVQVASPPTNLMVVQENATSIRVSWTPPTPLGYTSGYEIYYKSGSNGSVDVSGGSTDNHLLTDLHNGASYTISIVGKSKHFPSEHVHFPSRIPLVPGMPTVMVNSTTATTITLSWSDPKGSVDSYVVSWERDTSKECSDEDSGNTAITDGSTKYSIQRLEEGSSYNIRITAINMAGSVVSGLVMGMTMEIVPSAPPTSVSTYNVTSTSITVQWGAVDCLDQNGKIMGYSVLYRVQGSDTAQAINVSGDATTEVVISELTSNTMYSTEVAAVNSAGIGEYSISMIAVTKSNSTSMIAVTKIPDGGDCSSSTKYCASASIVAGYTLGGFIGGVFITAVLGAVIVVVFVRRMRTKVEMQHPQHKVVKQQNADVATSNNLAYGYVKRGGNTQHETYDVTTGAAMSNQELVYDTIPN